MKQVKLWRHWAPCHLVLTDSYLLLFTDVNDPASIVSTAITASCLCAEHSQCGSAVRGMWTHRAGYAVRCSWSRPSLGPYISLRRMSDMKGLSDSQLMCHAVYPCGMFV